MHNHACSRWLRASSGMLRHISYCWLIARVPPLRNSRPKQKWHLCEGTLSSYISRYSLTAIKTLYWSTLCRPITSADPAAFRQTPGIRACTALIRVLAHIHPTSSDCWASRGALESVSVSLVPGSSSPALLKD